MERLHEFFNIPSYYNNLTFDIHSESLMPLLNENPIDYMRHLYSTNSKLFYNVRDELVLRGIGFQPKFQNNYLLDRTYEIQHILYKNDNTYAFEKIDFAMLGANNFIERFNVCSDLFFNNMPLEGILEFTQDVSFVLLQDLFKGAGFLVVPINEYMASPIHTIGTSNEAKEKEKTKYYDEESLEIVPTNDSFRLDAPIKYFYEDTIFLPFLKYCHVNGIQKFSELTVDFVEQYKYQKHVRGKTAIKAMELYHGIHYKYNALEIDLRDGIVLLQDNPFKTILEFANIDYLAFIDDFYVADEVGMYQADFPFEKVHKACQQVIDSSEEIFAEKQQDEFNQLTCEIVDHPKYKYILSYTLAEIQGMFGTPWGNSLDLKAYLFDVLEDMDYKEILRDVLSELKYINGIQDILDKATIGLKPRELEVLLLRQTKTLQEVGDLVGVTRERIRQIEVKSRNRLATYKKQLNLKLYFQNCTEHSKLLKLNDFMRIFEIEGVLNEILLGIFFDIEEEITYLSELDCYILTSEYEGIRQNITGINYSEPIIEVDDLKQLFNEEVFNGVQDMVDLLIRSNNYKRVNDIYVKETISIIARINYLFENIIKEPLEMNDVGYEQFRSLMESVFDIQYDSNKRSAIARIANGENVILVDGNTFATHKGEAITEEFLLRMEQAIDNQLINFPYADPRSIYRDFELLMNQTELHSPVHLYSIIQIYLSDKYETGNGNTLYIYKSNADRLDAETILLNYLYVNDHEVKREKIEEDLNWSKLKLEQLIPGLKTVVMIGEGIVKTIESFDFTDEEVMELKSVIETELEKGYIFTRDLQFEIAFNIKLGPLIERCGLTDDVTLAAIIKWLYPSIYGFSKFLYQSNSAITKIEQVIALSFSEVVSRNEVLEFAQEKGYGIQTVHRMPTDIVREGLFYDYTNTKYINSGLLAFTDDVKQSLEDYLEQQFTENMYCPLFSLVGYSKVLLPISSYNWTEYLIGQFAEKVGYRKIRTHMDYRFEKSVLVKSDSTIKNFEQLVFHIVKTEYTGRYHEEDLAKYLVLKKMAHNPSRLTNEIYNSKLFKFDTFGFFELRGESNGIN